ncbi:Scr1 family TA system antitoxin-like transcriptional regulator [Streptomyces sp. 8K308]|uniref:Scr1 family TA system antitoxin-like transcriptional regulator n=1 Tax=Streptomyces sp. 8K308 TaxID=2530388 RepID=UPI001FB6F816|nr:Scr1 family TA system antitoxin-like transcriptional regulator [Streptomyces sp. 8K308]
MVDVENILGGTFVEGTDEVRVFETAFERVVAAALSVDDSRARIRLCLRGTEREVQP